MKNCLVILLSFLIFIQGVGFGLDDIFSIGRLMEHAEYHSDAYGDDFLTVLAEHYGSKRFDHTHENDQEDSRHKQLPFQHEQCHHAIAEVVLPEYEFSFKAPDIPIQEEMNAFYLDFFSSFEQSPLFQPPRHA